MGKIFTITMPDIGEGVMEGEIISWLKKVNDNVAQDEPVVVLMTDKATVELPSPYVGRLAKQYYNVGETAIKDKPLYDIEVESEREVVVAKEPEKKPVVAVAKIEKVAKEPSERALAAPPTRKFASDLNVDINQVSGSGPEGRVTNEDVIQHHAGTLKKKQLTPPLKLPGDQEVAIQGIRNLMAKRMTEAHAEIPHFSYFEQVEATRLVQLRQSVKQEAAKEGITVTYMPFIIRALSLTLLRYPTVNSSIDTEKNVLIVHQKHNIGIAISTANGLIVPVLKDVQSMHLQELIRAYEALKGRATANKLLPSDMKESTFSISNFGVLGGGGLWATPIINFPEVGILALARIHKEPLVRNEVIVVRDVLNLSWSFDHRVVDGDLAAEFSHHFSTLLQNPAALT